MSAGGSAPQRQPAATPRAVVAARAALALSAIGAISSPPVANAGAVIALLCLPFVPALGTRIATLARLPAARAIALFLAVMALSMLWADASWHDRLARWWSWRPLLLVMVGWLVWPDGPRAQVAFVRVLAGVIALSALASFAFWQFDPTMHLLPDRERGVLLRDHVLQGMAMVAGIVLVFVDGWSEALAGPGASAPGAAAPSLLRPRQGVRAALALLMLGNLLVVCVGRSGHVALLAAVCSLAWSCAPARMRLRALVLVGATVLAALFASPMVRDRFELGVHEIRAADEAGADAQRESSMGLRRSIWHRTAGIIADHPLLGVGAGGFAAQYAARIPADATGSEAARAKDTHNEYLRVQVEAGVLGTLAFLHLLWRLLTLRAQPAWGVAGRAVLLAWMATSLFNSHFENFDEAYLLGTLLGMLLAPWGAGSGAGGSDSRPSAAASTSS